MVVKKIYSLGEQTVQRDCARIHLFFFPRGRTAPFTCVRGQTAPREENDRVSTCTNVSNLSPLGLSLSPLSRSFRSSSPPYPLIIRTHPHSSAPIPPLDIQLLISSLRGRGVVLGRQRLRPPGSRPCHSFHSLDLRVDSSRCAYTQRHVVLFFTPQSSNSDGRARWTKQTS